MDWVTEPNNLLAIDTQTQADATDADWDMVPLALNLKIPPDYKEFSANWPAGTLGDFICFFQPH